MHASAAPEATERRYGVVGTPGRAQDCAGAPEGMPALDVEAGRPEVAGRSRAQRSLARFAWRSPSGEARDGAQAGFEVGVSSGCGWGAADHRFRAAVAGLRRNQNGRRRQARSSEGRCVRDAASRTGDAAPREARKRRAWTRRQWRSRGRPGGTRIGCATASGTSFVWDWS